MIKVMKASAGAGKTFNLVAEYIRALLKEQRFSIKNKRQEEWKKNVHRHILAVTFTNNSTNEMKERIIKELNLIAKKGDSKIAPKLLKEETWLTEDMLRDAATRLMEEILNDYSMMRVSTIDSFFSQTVRAFTRELGLDQTPAVDLDDKSVIAKAVDNLLTNLDPVTDKQLVKFLREITDEEMAKGKKFNIRSKLIEYAEIVLKEDYMNNADHEMTVDKAAEIKKRLLKIVKANDVEISKAWAKLNGLVNGMEGFIVKAATSFSNCKSDSSYLGYDVDRLFKKGFGTPAEKALLSAALEELKNQLHDKEALTARAELEWINITGLLGRLQTEIDRVCEEDDIILLAKNNQFIKQITGNCSTPFIYERVGVTTHEYMIDEFQDTSDTQWTNLVPLLIEANSKEESGALIVGDTKQSIYRFRNGDWKIMEQKVDEEFHRDGIEHATLMHNFRSYKEVIDFNNLLYGYQDGSYGKVVEATARKIEETTGQTSSIREIYGEGSRQEYKPDVQEGGKVKCVAIQSGKEEKFIDLAVKEIAERIKISIEETKALGDKANEHPEEHTIAVLVRKNDEGAAMAKELARQGIKFFSSESLKAEKNIAVRLIIALMGYVMRSEERLVKFELKSMLKYSVGSDEIDEEKINTLRHTPLKEFCQTARTLWGLDDANDGANTPYINTLEEFIRKYTTTYDQSPRHFLEYWAEKKSNLDIPMPEVKDAVNILTVHKSKGLEFGHVLLLMSERQWKAGIDSTHQQYKVGEREKLIIDLNSKLLNGTEYEKRRMAEFEESCIDTLNLLYVATTRARKDLTIVVEEASDPSKPNPDQFSMNKILLNAIDSEYIDEAIAIGEKETEEAETEAIEEIEEVAKVEGRPIKEKKLRKRKEFSEQRRHGIICHEMLARTETKSELDNTLAQMKCEGLITDADEQELREVFEKTAAHGWYDGQGTAIKEKEIAINGKIRRPDRIIIDGEKATVIDYKFGEIETGNHHKQVKEYCDALQKMGYTTEGYIYYYGEDKVVKC